MAIIFDETKGPIRVKLEAFGGALAFFKPAERNLAIRTALKGAGDFWIEGFLGKRFSQYSATTLGYRVSEKWKKAKEKWLGQAIPFVGFTPANGGNPPTWAKGRNQTKMMDAVRGSHAEGAFTAATQRITITIPFGHPVQSETSAVFRTVPTHEVDAMAREVGRVLSSILNGASATDRPRRWTLQGASSPLSARGLPDNAPRNFGSVSRKVG